MFLEPRFKETQDAKFCPSHCGCGSGSLQPGALLSGWGRSKPARGQAVSACPPLTSLSISPKAACFYGGRVTTPQPSLMPRLPFLDHRTDADADGASSSSGKPSSHSYPTWVYLCSFSHLPSYCSHPQQPEKAGPLLQVPRTLARSTPQEGLCLPCAHELSMGVNPAFSGYWGGLL